MFELYKLYKLSKQYCEIRNYALAGNTLQKMIRLKTELLGREYAGCGFDLYNLGLINTSLKNYDCARRFLLRALQIQRRDRELTRLIDVSETLQILATIRREKKTKFVMAQVA